jgi:pyrroloquinoline-quinone synthase
MLRCPACLILEYQNYDDLSKHMIERAHISDPLHVMWLNRYISVKKVNKKVLSEALENFFKSDVVKQWIISWMIRKFFSETPHPFIIQMQQPSRQVLLGYAYEHHHFLKQWVRSCSMIIGNTEHEDVQFFEIENILSEWYGIPGKEKSHHELLLRMGESYDASRSDIYDTKPLNATRHAISFWDNVARTFPFYEGLTAMHSLELIANRNLKNYGAKIGYFDPKILNDGSITEEAVAFLKEGYSADVSHSETALDLIDKYANTPDKRQNCMAVSIRSMEEFSDYLLARLERGEILENKQH